MLKKPDTIKRKQQHFPSKSIFVLAIAVFVGGMVGVSVKAQAQYTNLTRPESMRVTNQPSRPVGNQTVQLRANNANNQNQMQLNEALVQESAEEKSLRKDKIEKELKAESYKRAQDSLMPMTEEEIRRLLGHLRTTQEAIQTPIAPPPTPDIHIEDISLDPAAEPPVIQLAAGNVTTLTFLDMTGEPWPVIDMGVGGNFDVKPPEPGGHVVRITPLKEFGTGNLSVRLYGFKTPVTFEMRSGGSVVHYRYDARIPELGPNGKVSILESGIGISAGDKAMVSVLEGAQLSGAKELTVKGVDGRTSAYEYGDRVILRTPLNLLSPAWTASMSSADGMNVYSISKTPVLLLSHNGEMVRAHLSRKGEAYVE